MVGTHVRSIARAEQKLGFDQRAKQRVTHRAVQTPQPLGLRNRQAKTRHLDVLTLHTPKHVERLFCHLLVSRWAVWMNRRRLEKSNWYATTASRGKTPLTTIKTQKIRPGSHAE